MGAITLVKLKKILFSVPYFKSPNDSKLTGGNISNFYFANYLNSITNLEIVTASCNLSENIIKDFLISEIKIKSTGGLFGYLQFSIKNFIKLYFLCKHALKNNEPVLLISSTSSIPSTYLISKLFNIENIVVCRAYEDFIYGKYNPLNTNGAIKIIKKIISLGIVKLAYENSIIITNSKWMTEAIKKSFNTSRMIHVLYPPIKYIEKKYITNKSDLSIFKIGFINRGLHKGYDLIIQIAKKLNNLDIYVYGDISPFENLNESIKNLHLIGWKSSKEIFEDVSLMLIPSRWPEPFGRVSIESQLCGTPVLVSNYGGLTETVEKDMFIVDSYDEEAWVKKILFIFNNYEYANKSIFDNFNRLRQFDLSNHNSKIDEIVSK